ncbi:MAG TPA: 50S ribosomal protein L11 methyltransferase [Rhodopseudomonas sp.]
MHVAPLSAVPEIRLYVAHPGSRLSLLARPGEAGAGSPPPYWAYPWAGGLVLARYFLDRPATVRGRRVLDLGAGSGLVGIAAAKAGASAVIATETDRNALVSIDLNARENGVAIQILGEDITGDPPPPVDLLAVGDMFYDPALAERVTAFLGRCLDAGIEVLIGDPGRAYLPRARLRALAEYRVPDFGTVRQAESKPSTVFTLEPSR